MAHRKLGKYEISERLGRGGMAEVYRAYHANLDRFVAIKVLHAFLADDPEFKNRFEKEARNIAKLKHANIVQVYDFDYDEESESYYMVMELVEGPTLKERLFKLAEQGKLLPAAEALRVIKQAAGALAYAHSQNMVHRDVKPGNLMLDHDERVVLTDFGIAKIVTGAQFTSTGGMVGTPAYMAPEQGLGEPGDERSDLYSLGVILFQLLTGRLPYDADTPLAVILKHLNEPVPSARSYRPELPEAIDNVVMRLMAKDPATRYLNANELIVELEQLEQTLDLSGLASSAIPTVTRPPGNRVSSTPQPVLTPASRTATLRPVLASTGSPTNAMPRVAAPPTQANQRLAWLLAAAVLLVLILGGYLLAANQGLVPAIGLAPTVTPTETASLTPVIPTLTLQPTEIAARPVTEEASSANTETPTDEPTSTGTATSTATEPTSEPVISPTAAPTRVASATPTLTATANPTLTPTAAPTRTPRPTITASQTASPTATASPTVLDIPLLDMTLTLVQATRIVENRQATQRACDYNYRIIDQVPADGEFFPTNSVYVRDITLRNTGNCAWDRNTSLNFVSGESFSAGPRIFLREPVEVGREVILQFEGRTPIRGGNLTGTWELRTPNLIQIGESIDITIFAYTR